MAGRLSGEGPSRTRRTELPGRRTSSKQPSRLQALQARGPGLLRHFPGPTRRSTLSSGGRIIDTFLSEIPEALLPLRGSRVERAPGPSLLIPVCADVRRQLEGGIETLEAAHSRYVLLERALRRGQWQHEVQARLELLREQLRQEPELEKALTRIRQRARGEEWPDMEPALVLARGVEKCRTRLQALTHERLGRPMARESFAERLARLHQVLAQTIAAPVSSEERVLHHGAFEAYTPTPIWQCLWMLNYLLIAVGCQFLMFCASGDMMRIHGNGIPLRSFITITMLGLVMLRLTSNSPLLYLWELCQYRRSGRFWLTPERLVWHPTGKDPIHIPLQAIPPGGVRLRPARSVEVRLVDGRTLRLHHIHGAERLVSLIGRPACN